MKRVPVKRGKLVLVTWVDIQTGMGWEHKDHDDGIATCKSVGFITRSTPTHLAMSATVGGDETNTRIAIPWGCIVGFSEIGELARSK